MSSVSQSKMSKLSRLRSSYSEVQRVTEEQAVMSVGPHQFDTGNRHRGESSACPADPTDGVVDSSQVGQVQPNAPASSVSATARAVYSDVPAVFDPIDNDVDGKSGHLNSCISITEAYELWKAKPGRLTSNVVDFLRDPSPKDSPNIECSVIRHKGLLGSKLYATYRFGSDPKPGTDLTTTFMMATKKEALTDATYSIALTGDKHDEIASLRCNFAGSQYILKTQDSFEIAVVRYTTGMQTVSGRGPRKLEVVLPNRDSRVAGGVSEQFDSGIGLLAFKNLQPKWDSRMGRYVLNFSHRVSEASVKNFILVPSSDTTNDPEKHVLQFGKASEHVFSLDFRHPLSPLQAFGIALSSFDYKIFCD